MIYKEKLLWIKLFTSLILNLKYKFDSMLEQDIKKGIYK